MTVMQVKDSEQGLVRLCVIDLPEKDALSLRDQPQVLAGLLGLGALDIEHVEIFALDDLTGLGLEGYLADGHGIAEHELAAMRWQLDALSGVILLLRSAAITERPATLSITPPLRWVATFGEDRPAVPIGQTLHSDSATGTLPPPASTEPAPKSRWALVAMLLLVFALLIGLWLALSFW